MFIDLTGCRRLKVGLHTHTLRSDGHAGPEEAAAVYRAAGYDAIALTDHWVWNPAGEMGGLTILSGVEYDLSGHDPETGVLEIYHIVALGAERDPMVPEAWKRGDSPVRERVRETVKLIHAAGGMAVLAHPAWSLNTDEQLVATGPFDATEIYNSVSDWGMSDRPYSGLIIDQLAARGVHMPLLATDDTHYYDGDHCRGAVMVEAEAVEALGMIEAIKAGRFYATEGPEVHLTRESETKFSVACSPAVKIAFLSDKVWSAGRMVRGASLTHATYHAKPDESYVRVEVTDTEGRRGYSNIIKLRDVK